MYSQRQLPFEIACTVADLIIYTAKVSYTYVTMHYNQMHEEIEEIIVNADVKWLPVGWPGV